MSRATTSPAGRERRRRRSSPPAWRRRRGRLTLRIYLYTLFCVVLAVALFILVAVWLRPSPPPAIRVMHGEHGRRVFVTPCRPGDDCPPPPPTFVGPGHPPGPMRTRAIVPTQPFVVTGLALLAVVLVTSVVFARGLTRPLQRLEAVAEAFGRGEHQARASLERADEIGAVGRAFDDMAERTTQLMRSQRELMANISHELRTPLARMRVALDLANEGNADTARGVLREIECDLGELETLVADVLTSMRLDALAAPLRLQPTDPLEVIRQAEQRFAALAPGRRLCIAVPISPRPLLGDPMLLRRALDNLLDNARKYSDAAEAVELRLHQSDRLIAIEIEDRGIGISAADMAHIFTPFFRADRSRQRGTGGVGLGLSLARKIVEAHGGTIRAFSVEGQGTVMRVELPSAEESTLG